MFLLVVDDFRVKYVSKEQANNLIKTINKYHLLSVDWTRQEGFIVASR